MGCREGLVFRWTHRVVAKSGRGVPVEEILERYYVLKRRQKELEREADELRGQILSFYGEQGEKELAVGDYIIKVVRQERREYDDQQLYKALPDAELWRLLSKADPGKISGLVRLNVLSEEVLKQTYQVKEVSLLQVTRA